MRNPFIVIEGLDGSGKATQTEQLRQHFVKRQVRCRCITFPDYRQDSSALVKMYLDGAFGTDPNSVNPYAAASFYAVDRYASYQRFWKQDYLDGVCIIADRYVTSNLIYQLAKLPKEDWDSFIDWVLDYEYHKLKLPQPDIVIYLDMPAAISQTLMNQRYKGDEVQKDIHERNMKFLNRCRETALYSAKKLDWHVIACADYGQPKSIEAIHRDMLDIIACINDRKGI